MVDLYRSLSDIGDTISQNRDRQTLEDLGKGLASGSLNYKDTAAYAFKAGNPTLGLSLLKLGQEQDATKAFNDYVGTMGGGGQPTAPVAPSQSTTRPPVASTPQVWGDKEAEAAGLYEKTQPETAGLYNQTQTQPGSTAPIVPKPVQTESVPARVAQQQPGAATPVMPQNPASGRLEGLMRAVAHPGLPAGQRAVAVELLKKELENSRLDPEQKNYTLYAAQERAAGKEPVPFFEYQKELKRAGSTLINTAEGMDAAQTKARLAMDQHAVQDLSKRVVSGRAAIPVLDRIVELGDKIPGGWAGAAAPTVAKAFSSLGFAVPEGASNAELLVSMSRQFIPAVRDPGSTSNYEQQLYSSAVPSLVQSQEGRIKIARMFKAQIQRNSEIMAIYRKYAGTPELDQKLTELDNKPVFASDDRKALEAAQPGQRGGPTREELDAEIKRRGIQ